MIRKQVRFWLGVLISAIFLYVALRGLKLELVWQTIQGANYWWLIPGVGVYFLALVARTWRWHYMLRPLKPISLRTLFPVVTIGYMGNNIYPARAGEVLRAYILKRKEDVSLSANMATVVAERIFDGLTMLLFVFATLPFSHLAQQYERIVVGFSALFFGALLLFLLLASRPAWAHRILNLVLQYMVPERFHASSRGLLTRFIEGLESLRSGREVLMIFITSIVIWLLETVKYWFVMQAFPFNVNFYVLMLMNGVVNLFTTLPAAPGHVGTFDAPGIQILEAFGVPGEIATGYTLVLHAALWLPVTVVGAYFLWREQVSPTRVQHEVGTTTIGS